MNILDIHTHRFYDDSSRSILNCFPEDFVVFPGRYYSVGFHPWYISGDSYPDWEGFEEQVSSVEVLAVGEAGLDKLTGPDLSVQEEVFMKQAEIASRLAKPLIIHCVRAYNEIIRCKMAANPSIPWIIHGFRGKKELALELIGHGFYLSFGEKYQDAALLSTPLDRMFFETDESTVDIRMLYKKAAQLLSMDVGKLTDIIQQNIHNVFFR